MVEVVVGFGSGVETGLEGKPWMKKNKREEEERREVSRGNGNVNGEDDYAQSLV